MSEKVVINPQMMPVSQLVLLTVKVSRKEQQSIKITWLMYKLVYELIDFDQYQVINDRK